MATDAPSLIHFAGPPSSMATSLATLHPPLRDWFEHRFGEPTTAQRLAWPALATGVDLLLSSPTGSGKTLAAFLPVVHQLLTGTIADGIRCLYVAPLKALVADAGRNLRRCLKESGTLLRVGLRTGDSSPRSRRQFRLHPPDFLLTTPESLAVLLSQARAGELFRNLRWVVVDEVHALASSKRGADLALSLERLATLTADPPQRVGLSATCTPLSTAAQYLVGVGRPCVVAQVPDSAPLELRVEPLPPVTVPRGFLRQLVDRLLPELNASQTTLIFTNTRALAERLGWALRRLPAWADVVGVHHSSLSTAVRRGVEKRLKAGELRAVVSSASLELGIDIGTVDAVILVHPPGGVVRLLQRVGRAGHGPGRLRRGLVLTSSPGELLEATVTGASGRAGQCEPLREIRQPLDVLCQQLLGMACHRPWSADEAFTLARRAWPYRDLARPDFDDCLDYLTGRRRDGDLWLPSRLRWTGDEFRAADGRTARLLRRNIGSIVAEETRPVCMRTLPTQDSGLSTQDSALSEVLRPVGHVDEAFADRLRPGDRFLLDGRCLEFRAVEGRALVVDEVTGYPATPLWPGSGWPLSPELAQRLYLLRTQAAEALRDGPEVLVQLLREDYGLGEEAAEALVDFFQRQECVSEIPDAMTVLVEVIHGPGERNYYVHTPLNRAANDAVARVAVRRLVRDLGRTALSLVADLGFLLAVEGPELTPADLTTVLSSENFEAELSAAAADSVALRERFRCVALTGLMLLRNPLGRQRRVGGRSWAERRLFDEVSLTDPDFLLLRQARCELYAEVMDVAAGRAFVEGLPRKTLHWRWLPAPSPLAEEWPHPANGAMETVDGPAGALQRLHAMLTSDPGPPPGGG